MKHLYFILIFPAYIFSQIPDETSQIKISYSMEYKKVPFKMKMFKKHLPTNSTEYHSKLGLRSEIKLNTKIFGEEIINSTTMITSDQLSKSWIKTRTIVNDSLVEDQLIERVESKEKKLNNIEIGKSRKVILGYNCVSFSLEDDSTSTKGFLTLEINGRDEFKNHGLPLEFTTESKEENLVVITKAVKILVEPLDSSLFLF